MNVKPGLRLYSAVSTTEVMVVRTAEAELELTCGGEPMLTAASGAAPAGDLAGESLVGKRYTDAQTGLELLCVKAGTGTICVSSRPVELRTANALPSSD